MTGQSPLIEYGKDRVNSMKKFMAMLTTIVILASSVLQSSVFAAFNDVDDTNPYKNAITTLSKLSVIDGYDDGTFRPDDAITRAEFTKLIVYMLGFKDLEYQSYSFSDVSSSHWAANYIQTAYDRGIIAGFEDGTFGPDQQVTYEQALTMVVCTLGYEQFAMGLTPTTDSWADIYIQQANQLGLTKNISGQVYYEGASRGVIAQMLYNALEVEMYENNGYNWIKTEKTLLGDYLKVKKLKGTLVGIKDYVTEDCTHELLEDQMDVLSNDGEEVLINYSSYTQNSSDLNKYFGKNITVYYQQLSNNDDRILVNIDDETTKTNILDVNYDDISGFSGNTLKYYEETSKSKTVKLKEKDLTVRYNGKIVPADDTVNLTNPLTYETESYTRQEALELWLNPETSYFIYGKITLTDNSNDGIIDMIQIYDYDVMVAYAAPTTADYRITDKLVTGNYLILDPQSADYTYTITKNGTEIPVTSISTNDVILYAKSLDDSLYTLLVSNKTVNGSVTSMSSDSSRMTISGTTYDIGDKCISYIREKDDKELKVGSTGTFYLDEFGTVIFGTLNQTAVIPYAYISDAYLDYDEGGKEYITAYAPDISASSAASYPLKSTVKLNGSKVDAETAIDKIQLAASYSEDESEYAEKIYGAGKTPKNTTYAQPARLTIQNNEVTDIVILASDEIQTQNDDKEQIVKCKELGQYTYSSNSFSQNGKTAFSVNSSTVVIYVPSDRYQKKQYAKKTVSSAFTSGDSYYVEAYDISSSKIAGLIILYGNDGTLTSVKKDSDFSIVASLPESIYSEVRDDTVQKFDVYTGASNVTKSWTTYDQNEFSDIKVGDVIQFAYDSDNLAQGRINNIKFDDIAEILDGKKYNDQLFNWEEEIEPEEENNYQKFKFDYRFKKAGTSEDETYTSSTLGTVPNSRAVMFNVSQVLLDEKKLYVTKGGFKANGDGTYLIDDEDYEEITVSSSTKILRMEDDREEISRYAADTTTDLTINDLKDAKNYGIDCSKILVLMSKGNAKLIVIYN